MNSNEQQNPFAFHETDLNKEREKMRRNNNGECYTKEELFIIVNQEFQILNNITDINEKMMKDVEKNIDEYKKYYDFISTIFPYQLYFQIFLDNPKEIVKIHALKRLSIFSQYPSFPFDELIDSPCITFMLEILSQSNLEIAISPIINILTFLLKAHPEFRDSLIESEILDIISDKLFSPKVPAFLETILTITPELLPEQIEYINQLYYNLIVKNLSPNMNNNQIYTILYTIHSIVHLLKLEYEPFDYSFVTKYIKSLLKSHRKIVCETVRMIGYLPLPTIEFAEDCIKTMTGFRDLKIIHILLNVFIQKYGEWDHYEDIIIEACIQVHELEDASLNDNLLSLKAILLYFPFNQRYDDRIIDLMIQFISYPDVSLQIINGLIDMLENADFEEGEKESFFERVSEFIDEFQAVIEADEDEDVCRQVSYFLQEIEKETQE